MSEFRIPSAAAGVGATPAAHAAGKAALLVVDMQRNMFESTPAVARGMELLSSVSDLIARARAAGAPVIFVRNCGEPGDPDVPGSEGWELSPALPRQSAEPIVDKKKPDAFDGTNLGNLLRGRGVRRLVVAGLQSEFCIAATCRGGHARGYAVTLVEDAHGTYDSPDGGPTAQEIAAREAAELLAEGAVQLLSAARVNFA
jgi:nicotinamidase-related amidase